MAFMNIELLGTVFTDYNLNGVGAAAFQLEHDFFTQQDLVIRTAAAGGGTLLVNGVDYTLSGEDTDLSDRVTAAVGSTRNVYKNITVINVTYQSGDLYFSGKYIADENDAEDINDLQTQIDALDTLVGQVVPAGVVFPYGGTSAPTGFLLCDGASVSRTTYAALFAAIGTAFGTADGASFNVPDLRGRFLRGVDGAAGKDPDKAGRTALNAGGNTGDNVGSEQEDAMQRIRGSARFDANLVSVAGVFTDGGSASGGGTSGTDTTTALFDSADSVLPNPAKTSDEETRPLNVYVNYIIKT